MIALWNLVLHQRMENEMVDNNSLRREIGSFYDSYSAAYVEVIAGRPTADEYFYRKYYSIPLYVNEAESGDADASGKRSRWLLTDSDIHDFLLAGRETLEARDYHHSNILDRVIRVLNGNRVNLEIVVSRRRADDTEVERWAVGYGIAKFEAGWRIIDIYTTITAADTVAATWPPTVYA